MPETSKMFLLCACCGLKFLMPEYLFRHSLTSYWLQLDRNLIQKHTSHTTPRSCSLTLQDFQKGIGGEKNKTYVPSHFMSVNMTSYNYAIILMM